MRDRKRIWCYKGFEENAKLKYPYKSMYQITKELNKVLEEMIYGTQITKDRKKR